MAEPSLRFKRDDGSSYPEWKEYALADIMTERNEPHLITADAPQLSFTIEQGVIYPEDKKTNKRDFLMKDKDNKKFLLTEYNDIIYNPANLKFGAIHRNALGRGVVSPIYAIFQTSQNPEFIEGIVTNPKFIKSSLKFLEGTVEKLKTLKPRDFVKMHVWLPCLEEQKRIAGFLSSVDAVITASEEEVANLETQKKTAIKKIFSREVRFKKADGTNYVEWKSCYRLEEVSDFITKGATPTTYGFDWVEEGIPFFRNDAIQDNTFVYGDFSYISEDAHLALSRSEIKNGDILIAITGEIGKVGMVPKDILRGNINQHTARIRIVRNYIPYFVYQYLCSDTIQKSYKKIKTGLSMAQLSLEQIRSTEIPLVDIEEQRLIVGFLSDFDEAIAAAKKELELWKELKKGLLQQMFV